MGLGSTDPVVQHLEERNKHDCFGRSISLVGKSTHLLISNGVVV